MIIHATSVGALPNIWAFHHSYEELVRGKFTSWISTYAECCMPAVADLLALDNGPPAISSQKRKMLRLISQVVWNTLRFGTRFVTICHRQLTSSNCLQTQPILLHSFPYFFPFDLGLNS